MYIDTGDLILSAGWPVHQRMHIYLEARWTYFIGFGLPLAFLASLSGSLVIRYIQTM